MLSRNLYQERRIERRRQERVTQTKEQYRQRRILFDMMLSASMNTSQPEIPRVYFSLMSNADVMIDSLRFLNYCDLAKASLISKKLSEFIQTHRSSLPFLRVKEMLMEYHEEQLPDRYSRKSFSTITLFGVKNFDLDHKDWIKSNGYSATFEFEHKQSPPEPSNRISLHAAARFHESGSCIKEDSAPLTVVFSTFVKPNFHRIDCRRHWPMLQHFVRLLSDPFVYFERIQLVSLRNELWKPLVKNLKLTLTRTLCNDAEVCVENNAGEFLNWMKNYLRCSHLSLRSTGSPNDELAAFLLSGSTCTPLAVISGTYNKELEHNLVARFLTLKQIDRDQVIPSISFPWMISVHTIKEMFEDKFSDFLVREENTSESFLQVYEFTNSDIMQKLEVEFCKSRERMHLSLANCFMKVKNL
ncbi:hypothetical protein DdX_21492 [Ditylenchus destructor]|uniref:F-box domain-containing protein n=1 Tax=Ditylenchus destructor TaxID=166010 RepID=A0AAD4QT15_9BILA|nr:hypothetical protein DdX_21492 [Ditylenchus destructor]